MLTKETPGMIDAKEFDARPNSGAPISYLCSMPRPLPCNCNTPTPRPCGVGESMQEAKEK